MLPNPEVGEVTLQDYLKVIQKRLKLILVFLVIIPCTVTLFVFTTKPIYRATVSILIEKPAPDVQYYRTQYKVLASRALAKRVFEDLRLSEDPDFQGFKNPIAKLYSQITIEPVRNTHIVLVNVEDVDPLRAASIANALAKAYQQLYTSSIISIVDSAKPPSTPFKPKKSRDILISIFVSLFFGVGLSFFLEYLDSTIRTAEDGSLYVNLPFLGYLPSAHKEARTDVEKNLICYQKPKSTIAESYRAVRTSILFATPEDKSLKSILITSALPQEGKTFVVSNLSLIFSQINERIVLLDMDMRRPTIHKSFKLEQRMGLSDFLTGNVDSKTIIKNTFVPNLSLITSGTIPPNPSELLALAKIRTLFEELKSKFDRIIIDSPPILSVADASLLANIVDGVVLVIKGASTRMEAAVGAKEKILEAKGKIIGVIVNNIEPEKEDRYYYYHYYHIEEEGKKAKTETKI